jgi:hypothetical protein
LYESLKIPKEQSEAVKYWKIDNKKEIALPRSTEDKDIFGQLTMFYLCLGIHQVTNATYYYYHGTGKSLLYVYTTVQVA